MAYLGNEYQGVGKTEYIIIERWKHRVTIWHSEGLIMMWSVSFCCEIVLKSVRFKQTGC